jgi:hypothetical protein
MLSGYRRAGRPGSRTARRWSDPERAASRLSGCGSPHRAASGADICAKQVASALGEDDSFYFRGPAGNLNLRAQNLVLFNQIAEGVDDETWLYHLHRGDYSRWFREAIKDDVLADEVARVEEQRIGPTQTCTAIGGDRGALYCACVRSEPTRANGEQLPLGGWG